MYYPIKKASANPTRYFSLQPGWRKTWRICAVFTQPRRSTQPTKLHPLQRTRQRTRKFLIGANFCVGRGGNGTGGQSLPFPLPRSPASRTFVLLCLPTPALHYVASIFRLIKRIRNPGLTFKLCQNLTFLFIFWPFFWRGIIGTRWQLLQVSFLKLSFTNLVWPSLLTSRCRDESLSPLCNVIVIAI